MKSLSETIKKFSKSVVSDSKINPIIEVETKTHYGSTHIYIVSDQKDAISLLTNSKTLTPRNMKALKDLGFTIKEGSKEF